MYAPVIVFTYKRLDKTRECLNALCNNRDCDKTDIIIFSDGPKTPSDVESVESVRIYLRKFCDENKSFKNIQLVISEKNKGLATSIIEGVTKVINEYGTAIVVEDDLVTAEDFLEYMNLLNPVLEEIAKKENITLEELMLKNITLEDTGLFHYKGKQSTVYNRFIDNNIKTLKDLFDKINQNELNYGKNELKNNHNYYIHNEINGIIELIKYKYLAIIPDSLNNLLNYQINATDRITYFYPHPDYGFPGTILNNVYENEYIDEETLKKIDEFYKVLKSCGFDQSATKALIDIAYEEKINNISLGEFLSNLSLDKINQKFKKVERELKPFLNILNLLLDYYKNHYNLTTNLHK